MTTETVEVTDIISLADMAKLAGVGPAAVSNWKKRFPDSFPQPFTYVANGHTPLFRKHEFFVWYRDRYREGEMDPELAAFLREPIAAPHRPGTGLTNTAEVT